MRKEFLTYGSPAISEEEIAEVLDTIKSGWLGTGPKTERFEDAFAGYLDVKHCVAVSSCTAALHLSMLAAGIKKGDEVIVPAMTFCSTANAVIHTGATPVFADIEPHGMTIDPADVKRKITKRTRAILPVHLHGRPSDMDALRALARRHGLILIGDAAHAIETQYHGKTAGQLCDITCYSFYITKNMTTVEGGMVATERAQWADRIKVLALHGMSKDAWARYSDKGYRHYEVVSAGFKYNMTDLQASFGLHQLKRLEQNLARREEIWRAYNRGLAELPLTLPADPAPDTRHARHIYAVRVTRGSPLDRDELMDALYKRNIGTGVHYTALHLHKFYRKTFGYKKGDFPNAEGVGATTLSLPLSPGLTDKDVQDVIDAVQESLLS
ncbi:MAG: DegT/DnrJ/EryC1/StrS family aminotransferase [Chitinispirillaceae bacterium]|nr:DegT/DnrJ/EryC1/StrS family aminotransferase [Chitinispirillaceae bacterium]